MEISQKKSSMQPGRSKLIKDSNIQIIKNVHASIFEFTAREIVTKRIEDQEVEASELEALKDKQMEVKYLKMYIDLYNILTKTIASLDLR